MFFGYVLKMASPYLNMDDRKISDEAIVKNVAI